MSCGLPVPVVILVSMQYSVLIFCMQCCGVQKCIIILCVFFSCLFVSFQMLNKTLNHVSSFSAVVPIVPVVIPLAINRDFMVTFSPPDLINEISNITEQELRL